MPGSSHNWITKLSQETIMRQFCIGVLLSALCNFWEYCRATPWITQNKNAEHVLQIRFCMQNMFCKLGSASRTCSACRTYSAKSKLFQWIERADHVLLYEFCFINPYLFKSWHQNISNGLLEHSMFCSINPITFHRIDRAEHVLLYK